MNTLRRGSLYYGCVLAGFFLLLLAFHSDFYLGFHFPKPEQKLYDEIIDDYGKHLKEVAHIEGTPHFTDKGIVLYPGEKCLIKWHFNKSPNEEVVATPWFYKMPETTNYLEVVCDNQDKSTTVDNNFKGDQDVDITRTTKGVKSFDLILFSEVAKTAPQKEYLIFQRLKMTMSGNNQLPPLPELCYLYLCFLSVIAILWKTPATKIYAPFAGFGTLLLLIVQFKIFENQFVSNFFLCWIFLGCVWYFVVKKKKELLPIAAHLTFIFILIIAFDMRWQELTSLLAKPLDPDAITNMGIAKLNGLFNTEFREPLFIWAMKIFFGLFGESDINMRLVTVLLSLVIICLTYLFALFVFRSYSIGLLAALMMAVTKGFITQNMRGLRLELYCVCIMIFLLTLFWARTSKKQWSPLLAAFTGGVVMLNILSSLSFVYLILIMSAVRNRWKGKILLLVFIIPLTAVFPHLLHNKKVYNDYFYSANIHTVIFRNNEFAGQPGFPTREEVDQNGYVGPRVTPFHYIFGMHTFSEVVKNSFKGLNWILFKNDVPRLLLSNNQLLFYSFIIGGIAVVFSQWEVVVYLFLLNMTSYFLAGVKPYFLDWRLMAHIAPLVFLLAALGIERIFMFLYNAKSPTNIKI